MQPSGGSSPLPASPLPPSPYQQTYNPQTGLTFTGPQPGTPAAAPASPPRKQVAPKIVGVLVIIAVVFVVLLATGALDGLFGSSSSSLQNNVQVTNTSASHTCPLSGSPRETFVFTLINSGSVDANVALGFYLNDAQVTSGTYSAPSGSSTPYSVVAYLSSCPPSGSTYYLDLVSVTAA